METQATRRCEWFPRRRMKTSSRANAPVCWSVLLRKKLLTVWWWDGDIKMSSSKKEKRVLNHQKWGLHAKNTQYLLSLRLKSSAWMITTFFIADSTFSCRQSVRTNQQRPLCSPHATLDGVPRRRHICLCCVARSYWALAVGVYMDATASGCGGGAPAQTHLPMKRGRVCTGREQAAGAVCWWRRPPSGDAIKKYLPVVSWQMKRCRNIKK